MPTRPPRLLQLCRGGQIILKTNPSQSVSRTQSPPQHKPIPSLLTYPLVTDLAADGVPVAVTCRVLGFSKQGYYRWKART
jgi:hypothetical protein